jgi:N-acetylglucosaminyl-diphospho-decaprenol L-rhamnosyltransferase
MSAGWYFLVRSHGYIHLPPTASSPIVFASQAVGAADPAATVVIVNFNAGGHLAAVLTGLRNQDYSAFRAIIVDNASSDSSVAAARPAVQDDVRFDFIESKNNIGFAAAKNLAGSGTDTPWLALLNPDAVPTTDWLEQLMAATDRHPDAVMFGSTQLSLTDPEILDGTGDHYFAAGIPWRGGYGWPRITLPPEGEVFSPCAAAALYRTDIFRAAGGFEESFFCYIEDVDLAFRLRLRGHFCIQVPAAIVHHAGSATSGGPNSDFARYYGIRNMIWCFVKNMPAALFWPLLPFHVVMLIAYGIMASLRGRGRLFLRSIRDAIRGPPRV